MHIIVCGAGEFGLEIARKFSEKGHNVSVIDESPDKIAFIAENLDVFPLLGACTSAENLIKAGIKKADLLLATTEEDDTNVLVCALASKLTSCRKAARVRRLSLSGFHGASFKEFGVDLAFHPEGLAIVDLINVMEAPGSFEVVKIPDSDIAIRGFVVREESYCQGKTLGELSGEQKALNEVVFLSLLRDNQLLLPKPETTLREGDKVYVLAHEKDFSSVVKNFTFYFEPIKTVFIAGVNHSTDILVGSLLDLKYRVKLFEKDKTKCQALAEKFPKLATIHGSGSDMDLLDEEGISSCDCFIAAGANDEVNLVACLVARSFHVPVNIIFSDRSEHFPFIRSAGIDVIISPELSAMGNVIALTQENTLHKSLPVLFGKAELIDIPVRPDSPWIGKTAADIGFPEGSTAVLLARKNDSFIPKTGEILQSGDRLTVLSFQENVKKIEKMGRQ